MLDEENGVGMDFVEQVGGEGGHGFSVGCVECVECVRVLFSQPPRPSARRGGISRFWLSLSHNLHYVFGIPCNYNDLAFP